MEEVVLEDGGSGYAAPIDGESVFMLTRYYATGIGREYEAVVVGVYLDKGDADRDCGLRNEADRDTHYWSVVREVAVKGKGCVAYKALPKLGAGMFSRKVDAVKLPKVDRRKVHGKIVEWKVGDVLLVTENGLEVIDVAEMREREGVVRSPLYRRVMGL